MRQARAARTRRELLDAAQERFLEHGYHGTSVDAVAADAGYTTGAIFAAFKSKAGLFLATSDAMFARRLEQVRTLLEQTAGGSDRIAALAAQPSDPRDERWLLVTMEFWTHCAREPALLEQFARGYRRLHAGLAELIGDEAGPLGAASWASVTMALSNGLALARLLDPDGVPADLMARTLAILQAPDDPQR